MVAISPSRPATGPGLLEEYAEQLVELALLGGGPDGVTVIVADLAAVA
ncbi:hypothetical protein ACFWVM_01035 [Nocardia fluminea]